MATTPFTPTHRIETDRETVEVMLVDGIAYQKTEWDSLDTAEYERADDGRWLFQGQPFAGSVERVYQIAFMLESTGDFEIVEKFAAADNDAANAYAEANYAGREWYVLDCGGESINA